MTQEVSSSFDHQPECMTTELLAYYYVVCSMLELILVLRVLITVVLGQTSLLAVIYQMLTTRLAYMLELNISGTNGEVIPGPWEYQVGPSVGIEAGDHIWCSRYILERITEQAGVVLSLDPKPIEANGKRITLDQQSLPKTEPTMHSDDDSEKANHSETCMSSVSKQLEDDDLMILFKVIEEGADMEVDMPYASKIAADEDDSELTKFLAELEASLKMR
ncbi:hypothetical protein K1719_023154 [Acacia pycnantha]|nr:hypothetical protein K1719_023154 [Acacia pycnantha]